MSKVMKVLIAIVVIFALILTIAVVVIKANFNESDVKAFAREQLTEVLQRETSVGDVGISIFPLGIKVSDITIANNKGKGFSTIPFLDLSEVVITIDLKQLLIFQVAIDEIRLDGLIVNYEVMADGRTSIDGLGGESPADSNTTEVKPMDLSTIELPGTVKLKKFSIKDSKVIYWDKASGQKVVLNDINQNVKLSLDKTLENIKTTGLLTINELAVEDKASGIKAGKINIELSHDLKINLRKQIVEINDVAFGFQKVKVNVKGAVSNFMEDVLNLNLNIVSNEMNLADLFKEIPVSINPEIPKISSGGFAQFAVDVKGDLGDDLPSIKGAIKIKEMFISHSDVPAKLQNLNGDIAFTDNSVNIPSLGFNLDKNPVKIVANVVGLTKAPMVINDFQLDAKVDFEPLFALASKISEMPVGMTLKGILDAHISAKGKVDLDNPQNLNVSGKATLSNVLANLPDMIPVPVSLNGQSNFSNTKITSKLLTKFGKSDAEVNITLQDYLAFVAPEMGDVSKKTKVLVDIKSNNLNIDEIMPPPTAEEEETGDTELPEIPKNIIADVNINLVNTIFYRLTMSNFLMKLNVNDQIITDNLTANLYKGKISQSMVTNLKDPNNGIVKFKMDANNVDANDLISNGNDNIIGDSKLQQKIRDLDNTVYSKMNMNIDVATTGTPSTFVDNMIGAVDVFLIDGYLSGTALGEAIGGGVKDFEVMGKKPLNNIIKTDFKKMYFTDLNLGLKFNKGNVTVENVKAHNTPVGTMSLGGIINLAGDLNLDLDNILPKKITKKLEETLGGAKNAAAGALTGSNNKLLSAVGTKASEVSAYPTDKDGNALLFMNIGGTIDKPKVSIDSKRMKQAMGGSANSLKDDLKGNAQAKADELKNQAKVKVDEAKEQAKAKVDEAKKKAEAELAKKKADAKKKANKAKADAKIKAKKEADKAKEKAKEAAKKGLKKLGF